MMKSRKFWALLLALAMVLSLAACGGGSSGGEATPPADTAGANAPDDAGSGSPADAESDLAYVQGNGKLVIGYTVYAPMNYTWFKSLSLPA